MTRFAFPLACLVGMAGCDPGATPPLAAIRPAAAVPVVTIAPPALPQPTYEADVAPMLDRHCLACHDSATGEGGLVLDGDGPGLEAWTRVADALRSGAMPPPGRPRPSPGELVALATWLDAQVFRCSGPDAEPGRVTMRRLNRAEYDRTIRDLIGLDLGLAASFPADDLGEGFDTNGDVLSIPPILMEKFLEAADRAIAEAARSPGVWAKLIDPAPDAIPPSLRKPTFAARTEPVKRIGRPSPVGPVAEDPEVVALRRAGEVLRGFADRAFRRPATADELARLVGLVESARKDGDGPDEAIRHAFKAVLIAPAFLFHVEEELGQDGLQPLGDFELAARLSYFLWGSLPDDELYGLAVRGELGRGDHLADQARRMLRDPKAMALVDGFVAQWLQLGALRDATPDPGRFPDFDEPLRRSMLRETLLFAGAIVREDRPVSEFLDAGFTFVDERLARHYGISGVSGDRFRRVSLEGTGRSGVLTQASILTVTSNPTRTSPVRRGRWVLDTLLGVAPSPPPAGVEGLKPGSGEGRPETLRHRMERHRAEPGCASCHARMDPLGFALEGFDGIGSRRSLDEGRPIDASGTLPGGESFAGASGLRDVLVARREAFARCLAGKLLTYALGRGLGPSDRCAVDEIVSKLGEGGGRFSSLVAAVVESRPFRERSSPRRSR